MRWLQGETFSWLPSFHSLGIAGVRRLQIGERAVELASLVEDGVVEEGSTGGRDRPRKEVAEQHGELDVHDVIARTTTVREATEVAGPRSVRAREREARGSVGRVLAVRGVAEARRRAQSAE